jgi:HSP20 family molecular chaperone IbpA
VKAKKQSQSLYPWTTMERFFDGGFPFTESTLPTDLMMKPDWIARIVQEALGQSVPSESKELYTHTIFETHKAVIVRIQLPNSVNPELLRVYVGPTSLRVEGFPNQTEKKVRLLCEVNRVGIRSSFKDGILEIRMMKKRSSDQEMQINISIL